MNGASKGQSLQGRSWKVTGVSDHSAFFRNLPQILPANAVLVLEGGRHPEGLLAFVRKHEVTAGMEIATGTFWPRQPVHHLSATATVLRELADLTEQCAAPEVCDHLHAYKGGEMLLQWFDAFSEPLYVSKLVSQEQLELLCASLGVQYAEDQAPAGN
jgi:hypothetical protein